MATGDYEIGTGPDTLVLRVSETAYQGDAQFTVRIDGVPVGTFTATASHTAGQANTITIKGDWTAGGHTATIRFLNDAWGGAADKDRNLYLESMTYNGAAVASATREIDSDWYDVAVPFTDATGSTTGTTPPPPTNPPPTDPPPTGTTPPAPASLEVGTGPDTIVLRMSQDAYLSDAQFTVRVDGVLMGTFTAKAWHSSGQSDTLTIKGDWATGAHTVTVRFLNDAWGGSAATDRNLHLDGMTYNGVAVANAAREIDSDWYDVAVPFADATGPVAPPPPTTSPTSPPPTSPPPTTSLTPASSTVGSGPDTLVLKISQDAYLGDAQFTVHVDGVAIGTFVAKVSHASGQSDSLTVKGDWGTGGHNVAIRFLNDAWGGSAATDRNLHLDGMTYNGAPVANSTRVIDNDWQTVNVSFTDGAAAPPVTPTANPLRGEVNVLMRGQSNAQEFAMHGADRLETNLETALGVNVTMIAQYWDPHGNTIHSGTAFMDWDRDGQQASLLRAVNALPATAKDNPTVTVWMHNEYDQGTATLTTRQWMAEVEADAALVRGALGQTAASTPYLFVPIRYPYGDNFAVIQEGMNQFDQSAAFNARQSYEAYTGDILMNGWGGHMSPADALLAADKLTDNIAAMFRQDIVWP